MTSSICSDLTVIELASVLAGPAAGMFFAELGARVIKVEPPRGDVTRQWKVPGEDPKAPLSGYFSSINYHKEYCRLDLKTQSGRQQVYDWVSRADIVISNYKSENAARALGMDSSSLREQNSKLIYAHLSGFESYPHRTAYDVVVQAEIGFMSMNGTPDSGPLKMPLAMMDILAAHQLKEGILLALLERQQTGSGKLVRTSLERSGLVSLYNQATNQLMAGFTPGLAGSQHPNIAPYGDTFTTADDQQIVTAIGSDQQFAAFCDILNTDIAADNRFCDNAQRIRHREDLGRYLQMAIKQWNRNDLLERCIAQDIPIGAVRTMDDVVQSEFAQQLIREEQIEGEDTKRMSTIGFEISEI
jgi:crotonobetainyl-CoA:carnitine CoA-transferase CaiB-like acyl-CoA transferase